MRTSLSTSRRRAPQNHGAANNERRAGRTAIAALSDAGRERALIDWIVSKGGGVGPVEISRTDKEGWFLRSSSDIYAGTELVSLPAPCQMTFEDLSDPELMPVIQSVPEEFWSGRLSLKLLLERLKGKRSSFWPYLECLPLGVPGVPLFYNETAIQALQYPPLIQQVKKRCRWLMQLPLEARTLISRLAENEDTVPDTNLMGWALAIVSSRAFRIHGSGRPASMLPLIDLCNHSFAPNSEVKPSTTAKGTVSLVSAHNIQVGTFKGGAIGRAVVQKGDQVLINYGDLPNDDFLLDYGFIMKENPHDYVELKFNPDAIRAVEDLTETPTSARHSTTELPPELKAWQDRLLRDLKLTGFEANPSVKIRSGGEPIDPRFLAGARILTASTVLDEIPLDRLGQMKVSLDRSHDIRALRAVATTMVVALSQFSGDIHTDRDRLASTPNLDANERLAITFRIEKKQLLLDAIRHIANRIRSLRQ